MLRDEIKEWEQEMPEGLHEQFGECRYCGQGKMLHTAMPWDEEKCNEAATEMCDCTRAKMYTSKKKRKEDITGAITENFGEKAGMPLPDVETIMMAAVEAIAEERIGSVTISAGNIKCKISVTAKGAVRVTRAVTENNSVEV